VGLGWVVVVVGVGLGGVGDWGGGGRALVRPMQWWRVGRGDEGCSMCWEGCGRWDEEATIATADLYQAGEGDTGRQTDRQTDRQTG